MSRCASPGTRVFAASLAFLLLCSRATALDRQAPAQDGPSTPDPVVARLSEHFAGTRRPIVFVVDSFTFPPHVWRRVRNLVAFRLHRQEPGGTTRPDAATYLVRDSDLYVTAAAVLQHRTTNYEYVWCQLAAVIAHEAAHTAPLTERQALRAEAAQLRRCLAAGHLHSGAGAGWNPLAYLQKVEARLLKPREHY